MTFKPNVKTEIERVQMELDDAKEAISVLDNAIACGFLKDEHSLIAQKWIKEYESDIEKMEVALEQAKLAYENDEIPVGAALFNENDELIVSDHNRRELDQDPTSHAEILVLKAASKTYKSWRLEGSTLVVTLEPDPMCAGAIVNARVKRLIYGAPNEKAGAAWTLYNIPQDKRLNHYTEITDGILRKESEELLTSFFENKR